MLNFLMCLLTALLLPSSALAQATVTTVTTTIRDPLNYPLRQYGFILAVALIGGLTGWYAKVRRGEVHPGQLGVLIGELTTSALAGLLTFWCCEWLSVDKLLTACMVGLSGHLGGKAIEWAEAIARRKADAAAGVILKP